MVNLKEGDYVDCRIKDRVIVGPLDLHDEVKTFQIISTDNYGYYLFVPRYIHLDASKTIDIHRCRQLGIEDRYADEQIIYIVEGMIAGASKRDGMRCERCTDFVLMAAANQADGITFMCWSCRSNKYRWCYLFGCDGRFPRISMYSDMTGSLQRTRRRIGEEVIGQKFGKLTIVGLANLDKNRNRRVSCTCDCGSNKITTYNKLSTGNIRSCGCLRIENANKQLERATSKNPNLLKKMEPRLATAKRVYTARYSDGDLSFDDFLILSQKNCYYCQIQPSNVTNSYITKDDRYSREKKINGFFTYSGLDRVDSSLPHNKNNVVPSCIYCNKAKLDRTQADFFEWIGKVHHTHSDKILWLPESY